MRRLSGDEAIPMRPKVSAPYIRRGSFARYPHICFPIGTADLAIAVVKKTHAETLFRMTLPTHVCIMDVDAQAELAIYYVGLPTDTAIPEGAIHTETTLRHQYQRLRQRAAMDVARRTVSIGQNDREQVGMA